jgi:hypothetical protein
MLDEEYKQHMFSATNHREILGTSMKACILHLILDIPINPHH